MKDPLSILIFGDGKDEHLLRLKGLLTKCGVYNFAPGRIETDGHLSDEKQVGLFIVSLASVSSDQMETISAEARRLAVPVLYL